MASVRGQLRRWLALPMRRACLLQNAAAAPTLFHDGSCLSVRPFVPIAQAPRWWICRKPAGPAEAGFEPTGVRNHRNRLSLLLICQLRRTFQKGFIESMGWSLPLGTYAGTAVRIHFTFFLLIAWIAAMGFQQGGWPAAIDVTIFILLAFGSVVLHEFGHVFAARRYGISTPDITLLPIGGVARLERMPEKPGEEIIVALAGPAVNVVIAIVLIAFLGARFDLGDVSQIQEASSSLVARLAVVNVWLVLFNLLPAFPMDGGRVLRAALATRMSRVKATNAAAMAGQAMAVVFAFLGLFGNPLLLLIAMFVFFAASGEAAAVRSTETARGRSVADAMITQFKSLGPGSTADDAAKLLLATTQQEFPVLDNDQRLSGMVTRAALVETMNSSGPKTPVAQFMDTNVHRAGPNDALSDLVIPLQTGEFVAIAAVDSDGRLIGYVTRENFSELIMLQTAEPARR